MIMRDLSGTTSPSFVLHDMEIHSNLNGNPRVGDLALTSTGIYVFTTRGWEQTDGNGHDVILVESSPSRSVDLIVDSRDTSQVRIKDKLGYAGIKPIQIRAFGSNDVIQNFVICENYGYLELIYTKNQWQSVQNYHTVVHTDTEKTKIDNSSFTIDQDIL